MKDVLLLYDMIHRMMGYHRSPILPLACARLPGTGASYEYLHMLSYQHKIIHPVGGGASSTEESTNVPLLYTKIDTRTKSCCTIVVTTPSPPHPLRGDFSMQHRRELSYGIVVYSPCCLYAVCLQTARALPQTSSNYSGTILVPLRACSIFILLILL